ncbi:lysine-rich arabinogalactan protein 19 [Thrips palmi]|uniref:Lysine-rich arabinogalactan protein 19 n=1 Tax=Thrips palmi TaxID=161013 RepID=A0A6P9AFC1_THRPL|nr:lysine-rich arabinogalactan protein 19 [Thrips palmi]
MGPLGPLGPIPSPRMDFDEWTPLGHGDPLKNDPTYDYVPPVLDRVHYWMEESSARRDVDLNAVPVPATMLVPPPPPPPAPTTAAFTGAPPSYSSLNPFHHFEDRPVVPNVLFEEKPFGSFDAQGFGDVLRDAAPTPSPVVQHQPLLGPTPVAGPLLPTPHSPTPAPRPPRPPSPNAIRAEPAKSSKLAASTTTTTPLPSTTTARTAPMTTTSSSISSLVRGLLHREAATTASTLTTDPLFAHYKQPVTPVQGPAYLIIQGHSKVKTYGPVLRRI